MRFLDPKIDIAFKKVFGSEDHKKVTISFLNSILEYEGDRLIESIQFMNNEQLPVHPEKKENILDIICTDKSGRTFIIEMQNSWQAKFTNQIVWYGAKTYSSQLNAAKQYLDLNPVVVVAIVNKFNAFLEKTSYKSIYCLTDIKTKTDYLPDLTYAFIELKKFNKQEHELVGDDDKWIFFLKNIMSYEQIPDAFTAKEFQEACILLDQMSWPHPDYSYYQDMLVLSQVNAEKDDLYAQAELRVKEAEQRVAQEVAQRVAQETQHAIAKKLLSTGMKAEEIASVTNLSIEHIKKIGR